MSFVISTDLTSAATTVISISFLILTLSYEVALTVNFKPIGASGATDKLPYTSISAKCGFEEPYFISFIVAFDGNIETSKCISPPGTTVFLPSTLTS